MLTTMCSVVTAVALSRVLAGLITDPARREFADWTVELAVLAAALAGRAVASWWQARLAHRAGAGVVAELETAVLDAGARLGPRELENRRTEIAVVVGTGLSGLRDYLAGYLPALLLTALVPPVLLVVIFLHDPVSAGIAVVTLPLIPIFMILIGLLTQGRAAATLAATTRLSGQLLDLFAGMPTLRALGRERAGDEVSAGRVSAGRRAAHLARPADPGAAAEAPEAPSMAPRVRALGDSLRIRTMRALRMAFLSSMVLELLATLSVALIAVSIGLRLVYGEMDLYDGLVSLVLAPEVYLPLRTLGERFHAAQDGMAAADKAFAVLEPARVEQAGGEQAGAEPAAAPARESAAHIAIRGLGVRARDGWAPWALDADLRPGVLTVLSGPNGSGKSTALSAILGLIEPERGQVLVDGTDVRALDQRAWWDRLAWLPQRPVLVPGTLRENLELLGAGDFADLDRACAATGFDAVLAELPRGWDTVVGAGGHGLSLGQRQRLALTRVLATRRPVLLLDEPTAHLDEASEAGVLAALRARAAAGATVVVVGHRPTVLAAADAIVAVRSRDEVNAS
ncbi:ABC transporter ATP-binding protein/permease [Nocardia farcinica]|uniref:ABC transporter ATP-binding protein/permease n=1 Tax=Nocardia farcinica TaxID=37329 RepID=UPI003D78F9ED